MGTMELRKKKSLDAYDLWEGEPKKRPEKLHPSSKRDKKCPLPHPGQSYNPDPVEHKKLLQKVLNKELEFQKKQKSIRKAVDIKVNAKEVRQNETDELLSGIKHLIKAKKGDKTSKTKAYDSEDGSSTDEAFSDYDDKDFQVILGDKVVKEKRKSKQQRLRQLKDRLQRKAAKLRKLKNIRLSKFDGIKKMIKELDKKEKEAAANSKKHHRKPKEERLGQKFEPSDPLYCLSNELPSNLRDTSCPMNAIVREQLESFQSRLLVEPTAFQTKKRKYKKKEFERKIAAEQEA